MLAERQAWLDTHLHLLYHERLHYDWTENFPALQKIFSFEDYQLLAQGVGITATLHMEVDVREDEIEAETAVLEELSRQAATPPIVGFISACRPEHTDETAFKKFVERATAHPLIRGFRRVLHTQDDDLSTSENFRRHVRDLTYKGHVFELCVLPRQMAQAASLACACPQTAMMLDHCGTPNIAKGEFQPWKSALKPLAALPNVHCKISGLIAYGDVQRWPPGDIAAIVRDLKPYFETAIEMFGWHRVVWGSDYPVCNLTCGLSAWKQVTDELVSGASGDEVAALATDNARRIYRIH